MTGKGVSVFRVTVQKATNAYRGRCGPGYCGIQSCRENKRLNGAICSYLSEREASEITQSQRAQEKDGQEAWNGQGGGGGFQVQPGSPRMLIFWGTLSVGTQQPLILNFQRQSLR